MLKVLSIGSDRSLFIKDSDAQKRIREYGKLFDELHIIVFTKRNYQLPIINYQNQIGNKIWIYPTNSKFKPDYFWDAYQIGKKILENWKLKIENSVITCQDPFEAGLVGWFLKKKYKLPLQFQIHADIFSSYFWKESWKNKLRVLFAKFLLPKADGVRVVSERVKNSIIENCKLKIENSAIAVLPIFVDVKKIQSAKIKIDLRQKYPNYDFRILMASRLTKEKNIPMAIEAIHRLTQNNTRINAEKILLLIVGEGPEREALKSQITNYKLQNNVKFEPWTNDLASYYKTADLFLMTSNYEGYGRTVVEAMAAGLPVIMTDVGLAGEVLIDDLDGKIISVGSSLELREAIAEVLSHREKLEEFKKNMEKALSNFLTKEAYLSEYRKALEL